jgi:hypothetical protein
MRMATSSSLLPRKNNGVVAAMSDDPEEVTLKRGRRLEAPSANDVLANLIARRDECHAAVIAEQEEKKARQLEMLTRLKRDVPWSEYDGCEAFEEKNIRQPKQELIDQANEIIEEYAARDFKLTLRQLYYQFVARELLRNEQKEYNRLGEAVTDGRRLGLIRWDRIEDRTRRRSSISESSNTNFDGIMKSSLSLVGYGYSENLWDSQEYRPEVWVEKDALINVVSRGCFHGVPSFSTRGFCSEPLLYYAAKKFASYLDQGLTPVVLHLADCDPSGQRMTQDIQEKLWTFTRGGNVEVRRIGLHKAQALQYELPPNVVKDSDSRSAAYKDDHGDGCWELDALDPDVIIQLVRDELGKVIDEEAWKKAEEQQDTNAGSLEKTGAVIRRYRESIIWFARRKRFDEVAARFEALRGVA